VLSGLNGLIGLIRTFWTGSACRGKDSVSTSKGECASLGVIAFAFDSRIKRNTTNGIQSHEICVLE